MFSSDDSEEDESEEEEDKSEEEEDIEEEEDESEEDEYEEEASLEVNITKKSAKREVTNKRKSSKFLLYVHIILIFNIILILTFF